MSIWTGTSPQDFQAQLGRAIYVVHFFGGPVYAHVISSIRLLEWPVAWGRLACRWSFIFITGIRALALLSIGAMLIWFDCLLFGYKGTTLPLLAQTAQMIQQGVALMFMMIHAASIWQRHWVSYGLQLSYLIVWGITVATLVNIPANGRTPVPKVYFALAVAKSAFSGLLVIVMFVGLIWRQERPAHARSGWSARSLFIVLYEARYHYYILAFIAQLAPLLTVLAPPNPSGVLLLTIRFVAASTTTLVSSLLMIRVTETGTRCPVRNYCILVGPLVRYFGGGPGPPHESDIPATDPAELSNGTVKRQQKTLSFQRQETASPHAFYEVGVELRTLEAE